MIPKVSRGSDIGGLLRYLMGPGKANEHRDPHVVAAWDGAPQHHQPPSAGLDKAGRPRFDTRRLTAQLTDPAVAAGINATASAKTAARTAVDAGRSGGQGVVWHCSLRNHADDRVLSDAEWAEVVTDLLHRTDIATRGDLGACRWVAIRHAADHVHVAVVLVRQDTGQRVHPYRDYLRARETCRAAEDRLGLIPTAPADRTAAPAPTRAEREKATRAKNEGRGTGEPAREWLRRQVRLAAVQARTPDEFFQRLGDLGVEVRTRNSPTGQVTGYAVAAPGDRDAAGVPVWFAGRRLAGDLTLPRLQARWAAAPATSPIPPAPTERSRVGRAERDAALGEALAAAQDLLRLKDARPQSGRVSYSAALRGL